VTTPVMKWLDSRRSACSRREQAHFHHDSVGELALWNRQMEHVVEPGTFTVMVGSSAETIALKAQSGSCRRGDFPSAGTSTASLKPQPRRDP